MQAMKYIPKTVVIEYDDGLFVAGFSAKTQMVYKAASPTEAKKFTAVKAQEFIAKYAKEGTPFCYSTIRLHITKPGLKFDFEK